MKKITLPYLNIFPSRNNSYNRHGITDWKRVKEKEYVKAVYCHLAYLTSMPSTSCKMPGEAQAGIKIARRNSNHLRYANDTTLRAESKKELKSLLMKVKEEREKAGLKLNNQKMKIMASNPIVSWKIDGETMETMTDYFLGLQNQCRW